MFWAQVGRDRHSHLGGTGQYSGEQVTCEQRDVLQRQPDVRRPGMGEKGVHSGNVDRAEEVKAESGGWTGREEKAIHLC